MATAWDLLQRFTDAIKERMPGMEVYGDDIVFEEDGSTYGVAAQWTNDGFKYFKVPFTFNADTSEVTLSDPSQTVEVERTTEYVQFSIAPGAQRYECEWDDKAYAIRGLEVLRTGDYRDGDIPISDAWITKALTTFEKLKTEQSYYPPVTLGHSLIVEQPAIGYIDKMRKVGDTLLADVVGISADIFHKMKKGAYPYRSLEFFHKTAEIMGCAFLSRAPEVKTAPMIAPEYRTMFAGDLSECAVVVIQPNGAMEVDTMPVPKKEDTTPTLESAEQITELQKSGSEKDAKIAEQAEQIEKFAVDSREKDVRTSIEALGVTPGVLADPAVNRLIKQVATTDTVTTFAAEDGKEVKQTPAELLGAAVGSLVTMAKAGTFLKKEGEKAKSNRDGTAGEPFKNDGEPKEDGEDLTEFGKADHLRDTRVKKLMKNNEVTYPVAFEQVGRMTADELKELD